MNFMLVFRTLVTSVAILMTSCATQQKQEQEQAPTARVLSEHEAVLVGRWEEQNSKASLNWVEFAQNGSADFYLRGKSIKESMIEDRGTLSFQVNADGNPQSLDFVAKRIDGAVLTLPCIVEFVETDGLKLRCSFSGTRPTSFEGASKKEYVRLSKQK